MSVTNLAQFALFLLLVTVLVKPVGGYLATVFVGERTPLDPVLRPIERAFYRLSGVDPGHEMDFKEYARSFVLFGLIGTLLLYVILRLQGYFPGPNVNALTSPITPDLAFNTAVSFTTTTTWQAYAGESTMSYASQIVGLAAQSFFAGAGGLAVGIAFIRGFAGNRTSSLGNFWVDLVRAILWVLLPTSIIGALFLIWQGVPMNFNAYAQATTLEGVHQTIAQGPVAAQQWIELMGTNGGGFFSANTAHPYENPTPLTNFVEMLAIVIVPASLTNTFGRMIGRPRQGWVLYWVMAGLFAVGLVTLAIAEQAGNPRLAASFSNVTSDASALTMQPGGNMEGKEVRFGIGSSALTEEVTSDTSTGSVNSAPDSYTPIGGAVALVNMLVGDIIFGGLGGGLYGMVMVALLGLFITGLMVGRTPEYVGKKIQASEIKLIMIYTLIGPAAILLLTALAIVTPAGLAGLTTNTGPHGLSSILFAYSSNFTNNGQTFGGLSSNSPFYNLTTVVAMLLGRFGLAIPALALAEHFAMQPRREPTPGTLPTDSPLFGSVIIGTVMIVGALTYFAVVALGPIIEHVLLVK